MALISDQGDPPDDDVDYDYSEFRCQRCGCADLQIMKPPGLPPRLIGGEWRGSWFGGSSGKARCNNCGYEFRIIAEDV